jgi:ferrochelatase
MAQQSDYEPQLQEACRLVSAKVGRDDATLVYQSRSGPPSQPWLEPDICDYLKERSAAGCTDIVVVPIGFISDHMEVIYDLDTEAQQVCEEVGLNMVRAGTVGTHPRFVQMIRELILERHASADRLCLGDRGPCHDICPENCCPAPQRPPARPAPA